jgi:hypothetical protein
MSGCDGSNDARVALEPEAGRSMVATPSSGRPDQHAPIRRQRPSVLFLAQLIAVAQKAPQTRQRSRAEPRIATAAYAASAAHTEPAPTLSRMT